MAEAGEDVLERTKVREALAVFQSAERLEAAASELLTAGFDRADLDLMTTVETAKEKLAGQYEPTEDLGKTPNAPHRAFIGKEDKTLLLAGVFGVLTYIGATAAALGVVASGGAVALAAAAALAGGAAAGGLGALITKLIGREPAQALQEQMAQGGLVLSVRVRTPEHEKRAEDILRKHGGTQVRVQEVEIQKRLADIPLSSVRPDPWLGGERLGEA